jgi:hypothetical protein
LAPDGSPDLSELEGSDIVSVDEEEFGVIPDLFFEFFEVVGFPGGPVFVSFVDHFLDERNFFVLFLKKNDKIG